MTLVYLHIALWLLWSTQFWRETHRHPDKDLIPVYITGTVGDVVGFSLVAYCVASMIDTTALNLPLLLCCGAVAAGCTYVLHSYWKAQAQWQVGSMYEAKTGRPLWGAYLHNLYVWFVATLVLLYLVNGIVYAAWPLWPWFMVGIAWYTATCVIDRARGVI